MTQAPKIRTLETWANKSVEAKKDFDANIAAIFVKFEGLDSQESKESTESRE